MSVERKRTAMDHDPVDLKELLIPMTVVSRSGQPVTQPYVLWVNLEHIAYIDPANRQVKLRDGVLLVVTESSLVEAGLLTP